MTPLIQQLNDALAEAIERVRRGIVQVRQEDGAGGGTGIVVQEGGLVVTNAHVVRRRYPYVTLHDGRVLRAHVVAHEPRLDLALLSVEATDLPALPLGDSLAARPGDFVLAVGHPWGVVGAATAGVLVATSGEPFVGARDYLVADLHLRPGNSGGPLVDASGRVLGINTMLIGSGHGVAIPAHTVRAFLQRSVPVSGSPAKVGVKGARWRSRTS